jgi:hypothetical protein
MGKILRLETDKWTYTVVDYEIETFSAASFLLRPRDGSKVVHIIPTRVVTQITLEAEETEVKDESAA